MLYPAMGHFNNAYLREWVIVKLGLCYFQDNNNHTHTYMYIQVYVL